MERKKIITLADKTQLTLSVDTPLAPFEAWTYTNWGEVEPVTVRYCGVLDYAEFYDENGFEIKKAVIFGSEQSASLTLWRREVATLTKDLKRREAEHGGKVDPKTIDMAGYSPWGITTPEQDMVFTIKQLSKARRNLRQVMKGITPPSLPFNPMKKLAQVAVKHGR